MSKEEKALLEYFKDDELAANVWKSKYTHKGEKTPDDMHRRLAKEFARADKKYQESERQMALDGSTALIWRIAYIPCYKPSLVKIMDYLINKYKENTDLKKLTCECCGIEYETNINRTRCSKKCADTMKKRRYKSNALFRVKYDKETMVRTTVDIFGYIRRAVY